jgi:hypothetical protein
MPRMFVCSCCGLLTSFGQGLAQQRKAIEGIWATDEQFLVELSIKNQH